MDHAKYFIFSLFLALFCAPLATHALESSSASFEIHASAIDSIAGSSSSATFQALQAGGQNSTGISTASSFEDFSGILYWMKNSYTPQYEQTHFRWRNDDGTQTTATWHQVQDGTYTSFPKTTTARLRFEVSNSGWTRGSAPTFQLQYATSTNCSLGSYIAVPTNTNYAWQIVTSTNFSDGDTTTNQLTPSNNSFVAGQMKSTGNTTSAITLASNNFTEIEYAIQATDNAVSNTTYCFRLLDTNLTPTRMLYTRYAKAVLAGYTASGTVISSTYDTNTVYGAAYNSILWQGILNNGKVQFQLGTSNCANGATNPPTCDSGTWSYYGPLCTTASDDWYDPGDSDTPIAIGCGTIHNNKRYFRYQVQLCSLTDCVTSGSTSPIITEIDVNWSP